MPILSDGFDLPNAVRTIVYVGGRAVAVYDTGGFKPPIVFVHGNSSSSRVWRRQFDGLLSSSHRLIAIDLPGHGASARAAPGERGFTYNLPGYAEILVDVALQRGAESAIFVGCSLGGHVVLQAADRLPDASGFLIFGAPPIGDPPDLSAFLKLGLGFIADLTEEQAVEYVSDCMLADAADIPDFFVDDVMTTDGAARAWLGGSFVPGGYADEVEIVARMSKPLAILHGRGEQIVNADYLRALHMPTLWRGAVQVVSGAGHAIHWEQPSQFESALALFAEECARPPVPAKLRAYG